MVDVRNLVKINEQSYVPVTVILPLREVRAFRRYNLDLDLLFRNTLAETVEELRQHEERVPDDKTPDSDVNDEPIVKRRGRPKKTYTPSVDDEMTMSEE